MYDVTHLRTLREFAVRGTLQATADALGYTSSAVSQHLSALTREAGTALTRRVGRRLVLTSAGAALARSAEDVLGALERARAGVAATLASPHGTVRLAIFQSAALALVPRTLTLLSRNAPEVRVEITQAEPAQALEDTWARQYDLVVAEEYPHHSAPHHSELVRETLVRDEIALASALANPVREIGAAAAMPWVMEPLGAASRHFAEQACRVAGFEPDVRFETADLQAHLALIAAGHAVALMPGLMVASAPVGVALTSLAEPARRTVFAAFRGSSRTDPAVSAVREALRRGAQDLRAGT
ncbi:LysR family transcriptional regulator [Demequina litorisediminis]|uniref:Transcriptional regulator n=1 Tax=Demequina litorisediminis TaxID=1849022 RepID=A0ABQ6IIQ0_9MICO|nr:LysR substrate-binding domain-containing protein [Demequina litorisediminis]GMA37594.1 transcriptional regulator [Demequina litorisediminis]